MELSQVLSQLSDLEFNELLQKAYSSPDGEPFRVENVRAQNGKKEVTICFQTSGKRETIEI